MSRPYYNAYNFGQMLFKIRTIPLKTSSSFDEAEPEQIRECANGPGPQKWSDKIRQAIDKVLRIYDPAFVVHDWDFDSELNDGGRTLFHLVNSRMLENCERLARDAYPMPPRKWTWLHLVAPQDWCVVWKRWRSLTGARALFLLVESDEGYAAWFDACQRRMVRKAEGK